MNPVEEMCRSYLELAEVREVQKDDCIVTLPVLDRFNDWMSVRVSISSGICRISDMGFVADDLSSAGIGYVPGGNSRYDSMISLISSNTMCRFDEAKREFYAECNVADMGSRMMYFLQGISHLDFMAYNTQGFITSSNIRFRFTVASYFRKRGCDGFTEAPVFKGDKGQRYSFGFQMPNSAIVDLLTENNANNKYAIIYKWNGARKGDLRFYGAPLYVIENYDRNDRHKDIDEEMDEQMISRLPWSDKNLIDRYILAS